MRAFCLKHSEFLNGRGNPQLGDPITSMRSDSSTANVPYELLTEKQNKLKIGQNGDKVAVHVEASDSISDKSGDSESQEIELSDSRLNDVLISECADGDQIYNVGVSERSDNEDVNLSGSPNLALILKKVLSKCYFMLVFNFDVLVWRYTNYFCHCFICTLNLSHKSVMM